MIHKNDYLKFIQYARNLSPATCHHYALILGMFDDWCHVHNLNEQSITQADVMKWIMQQTANEVKAVTVNNRVVAMRRYYDYCCMMHDYPLNPFVAIKPLKVPKLLPKFIPGEVIKEAVAAIPMNSFVGFRNAAIIMLFYCTGIRRSELLHLSVSDVDTTSLILHVFGKGRKERLCPIPQKCLPYLIGWQNWRSVNVGASSSFYFCGTSGKPISATEVATIVQQVFNGFVERKRQHPHILRHSFATVMMQAGVPIPDIARLLGHNSTATTLRYLSLSPANQYSNIVNNVFK